MKKQKPKIFKIYNVDQAKEEIQNLINDKCNFEYEETANTCKIWVDTSRGRICYWYLEKTKSKYFLIMLKKLKTEIELNACLVEACTYSPNIEDVNYFKFLPRVNDLVADSGSIYALKNVYEADISHAYYRAAYVMGFISKSLYMEIIKTMTKEDRLRLLGCIATVKIKRCFEMGEEITEPVITKSEICRKAWFKICHYIDTALLELKGALGKDFLFYWVDGIYFKYETSKDDFKNSEHWHSIRRVFYKFNVEFKCIAIPLFTLTNMGEHLEVNIHKPNGKVKRFFPEKRQIKTYSIIELNDLKN